MKCLIVLSAFVAVACAANGDQNPKVFSALDVLRGKDPLQTDEIQQLVAAAVAGQDFPILSEIPQANIDCGSFKQAGFYADEAGQCQVFHRCDINGNLTSYLCPNMTLFNQITLVCDWFWNIDCSKSRQFQDYSNSRLYQEGNRLLDDENDYELKAATGAVQSSAGARSSSSKSSSSSSQSSSSSVKRRRVKKQRKSSSQSSQTSEESSR